MDRSPNFMVALGLAGCQSRPAYSASTATQARASVQPGINAEFLKPSLNLTQWVERFKREGREIFTDREKIVVNGSSLTI